MWKCGEGGVKGVCVGVVGEVWRSVHVHVFKCVWVHMHANLNKKLSNHLQPL